MKIKIKNHRRNWGAVKSAIIWGAFIILLGLAAFQGGYIWRDREADELRREIHRIDRRVMEINGRLVGVEAAYKRR